MSPFHFADCNFISNTLLFHLVNLHIDFVSGEIGAEGYKYKGPTAAEPS